MGETTGIQWTDASVNLWWGCTKVGPGCDHCYAETWSKRTGESIWGVGAPRRKIKSAASLLMKLDTSGSEFFAANGRRRRVFIQSMSDLFDNEVPIEWFAEAWGLIENAKRLQIQIVTKRVSIVEKRLAEAGAKAWPAHAGLMATVCNQTEANRDVPRLLALKAKLGIPWVGISAEPLLGPIDFRNIVQGETLTDALDGMSEVGVVEDVDRLVAINPKYREHAKLDGVIVGGESGPGARPMHPDWARSIRDQCAAAGVPFFFKQWGEWGPSTPETAMSPHSGWLALRGGLVQHKDARLLYPENGAAFIERVGKSRAGRLLDGREHNDLPGGVSHG